MNTELRGLDHAPDGFWSLETFKDCICPYCKFYGFKCFQTINQVEIEYMQMECYNDKYTVWRGGE